MASGVRTQLVNLFGLHGPCSIAEIAPCVGTYPEALYHHVRRLQAAGFLVRTGDQVRHGRKEATYDLVAQRLELQKPPWDDSYIRAVERLTKSLFEASAKEATRILPLRAAGSEEAATAFVRRVDCRLSAGKALELRRRIEALDAWVLGEAETDGVSHSYLVAVTPLIGK